MDERIQKNWQKIKKALEDNNKTDCFLYRRACEIINNKRDPMEGGFLKNL